MYCPDIAENTIRKVQYDILHLIIREGQDVEDTLEVNNISFCVDNPDLSSEDLSDLVTPIAKKHMSQMMIEKHCKSDKTHYERLHNWEVKTNDENGEPYYIDYDQIDEVIEKLKENPSSKRCVLTLWQPQDVNDKYALSWTFAQLFIRNNKLIITTYFRSCDIYNALPWNAQGIAKLQKEIAKRLEVEVGGFICHIGSAHIYKVHETQIMKYLAKNLNTFISILCSD